MSSGEQRDIRYAAETLYRNAQPSQSQPQPGPSRYGLWKFCYAFNQSQFTQRTA